MILDRAMRPRRPLDPFWLMAPTALLLGALQPAAKPASLNAWPRLLERLARAGRLCQASQQIMWNGSVVQSGGGGIHKKRF